MTAGDAAALAPLRLENGKQRTRQAQWSRSTRLSEMVWWSAWFSLLERERQIQNLRATFLGRATLQMLDVR